MSTRIGVIADAKLMDRAFGAGAEYFEPYVVGGVALQDGDRWVANPELDGRFPSFAVAFPGSISLVDPIAGLGPIEDYLDQVLPLVAALAEPGAKVVLGSGRSRNIPDHIGREAAEVQFAAAVRMIRAKGEDHGLEYLLEPLNSGETNLLNSIAEAVEFIDRYELDIRLVADLHHVVQDHQPLQDTGVHLARVGHVHLAGPGRGPLDAEGSVWRAYLRVLRDGGYQGAMSLECDWGSDFDSEVGSSLELLRAELAA
jgi:sugar phosphate isomerase/epimerase